MLDAGLLDQDAAVGRLMTASSPIGAMVSSVMYLARWAVHSSYFSNSKAPTRQMMASSLGIEGMIAIGPKECPRADDIRATLDLAVQTLDRVRRV